MKENDSQRAYFMKTRFSPRTQKFSASACLGAAIIFHVFGPSAHAAALIGLGHLTDPIAGASIAYGVSADGRTVVGHATSGALGQGGQEAFRWTAEEGMVGLGGSPHPQYPVFSTALAVSADGGIVAGYDFGSGEIFRWKAQEGRVGLGFPATPGGLLRGVGLSADGGTIVGSRAVSGGLSEAVRWTEAEGAAGLGTLDSGTFSFSFGSAVSADGSTVVGMSQWKAFRWTQAEGMVGLDSLSEDHTGEALAVSADGGVIVGRATSIEGTEATRWTESEGTIGLGDLPGGQFHSAALGVSGDGSVIVGYGSVDSGSLYEAFLWTEASGMRPLTDVLADLGVDLAADGWTTLVEANAISSDGRFVVGWGYHSDGNGGLFTEAFLADLAPIPEPETWCLISGFALVGVAGVRQFLRRFSGHHQMSRTATG